MPDSQVYVTTNGLTMLKAEHENLVKNKRKEVAAKIATARELGDSDDVNSEYEAAREEQSFVEGRILELEEILKNAVIIDKPKVTKAVVVGSTVTVEIDDKNEVYTIVGSVESSPTDGRISHESPVGKALMGLKVGDTVEVSTPVAAIKYRVKKIS